MSEPAPGVVEKSRAERFGEVLAVLWYLFWVAGMVRLTLEMDTWLFRVLAGGTVLYLCYRWWRFVTDDARSWR